MPSTHQATRTSLRVLGLVLTGLFLLPLIAGPDVEQNPSAGIIYVLFWVGTLVIASVILGPVWRLLNPLRTLHLLACKALRADPRHGVLRLSPRVGRWPAALAILSFAWLELVAPNRDTLFVLRTYVLIYAVWVLWGAALVVSDGSRQPTASRSCRRSMPACRPSGVAPTASWCSVTHSTACAGMPLGPWDRRDRRGPARVDGFRRDERCHLVVPPRAAIVVAAGGLGHRGSARHGRPGRVDVLAGLSLVGSTSAAPPPTGR